jgi:hypothetical protein
MQATIIEPFTRLAVTTPPMGLSLLLSVRKARLIAKSHDLCESGVNYLRTMPPPVDITICVSWVSMFLKVSLF